MTEDEAIGVIEQMRVQYQCTGHDADIIREATQTLARGIIERAETARVAAEAKAEADAAANAEAEAANAKNKVDAEAESNGAKTDKPLRITSPATTDAKDGA